MPCHTAIESKKVLVGENESVEDVLKAIKHEKVFDAAVVDDEGRFLGVFSRKVLLKNLIPVSVAMSDGVQIDVRVTAAPGVAKRLHNFKTHKVHEIMDRKPTRVRPDTPIWEGVSLLIKHGGPLCVIDDSEKFYGFITHKSLFEDLENMQTTDS